MAKICPRIGGRIDECSPMLMPDTLAFRRRCNHFNIVWWMMVLAGCAVVVAPRTSVVVVLYFAVLGVCRVSQSATWRKLPAPLAAFLIGFVAWTGVTMFLSGEVWSQCLQYIKFVGLIVVGLSAALSAGTVEKRELSGFCLGLLIGTGVIAIAVGYAIVVGDSLWGSYYFDPLTVNNSSAVIMSLTFWPAMFIIRRYMGLNPWLFGAPWFGLLFIMSSTAAVLGVVIGGVLALLWRPIGRTASLLVGAAAIILTLLAPSLINLSGVSQYMNPAVVNAESSIPFSIRHRFAIWSFAVEKIEEKPILGWGVGGSQRVPQTERSLSPNMEIMPLHPHNLSLQTRLELGLPGGLLLCGLILSAFMLIGRQINKPTVGGVALASASSWLFIANTSYGMWQSWWIASVFLIAVLIVSLDAAEAAEAV